MREIPIHFFAIVGAVVAKMAVVTIGSVTYETKPFKLFL